MKLFKYILVATIVLLIIAIVFFTTGNFNKPTQFNSSPTNQYNSNNVSRLNVTPNDVNIIVIRNNSSSTLDADPILVSSDSVFNNITWSKYSNVEKIRVHDNYIAEPNDVINHTFIEFEIDITVKDPDNTRELYREMAGIAVEMRQMLGPDSSVGVWGLVNGIDSYHVGMLPYENRVYAIDHYHPFAYKNDIYLIPGADIYDYHSYTIVNNSVIEP